MCTFLLAYQEITVTVSKIQKLHTGPQLCQPAFLPCHRLPIYLLIPQQRRVCNRSKKMLTKLLVHSLPRSLASLAASARKNDTKCSCSTSKTATRNDRAVFLQSTVMKKMDRNYHSMCFCYRSSPFGIFRNCLCYRTSSINYNQYNAIKTKVCYKD